MDYAQSINDLFTRDELIEMFEKDRKVKDLPGKLRKNGFEYTQVLRGDRSCIYEQRVHENKRAYEVFLIKIKPVRKIGEKTIEANEQFPNNESFGLWAWTYGTYEKALSKYSKLEGIPDIR